MPDTYGPIEAVYKQEYASNVQLAIQQKDSRLPDTFTYIPGLKGQQMQAVELIGTSEAIVDDSETSPTPDIPPKHLGINVRPRRVSWGRVIREGQQIKAAVDYQSPYVQEGAAAVNRGRDSILVNAIFGNKLIANDETGSVNAVAFDTANRQMPVNYGGGGNAGMTFKKFIHGLTMLGLTNLDVDAEDITMLQTWKQNENLYNEVQFVSQDYRNRAVLDTDSKRIMSFMGVRFKIYQGLPVDGNGYRRCPMYAKSGMHWGEAMPLRTFIERNPDRQYRPHPFMETYFGATRSEDEKVVDILCLEA